MIFLEKKIKLVSHNSSRAKCLMKRVIKDKTVMPKEFIYHMASIYKGKG